MNFIPADEAARNIVRQELETSLAIEAGAGTGKTTLLVDRLTNLLTRYDLNELAAITFSEKAAGELVDRMRRKLETVANADSPLFKAPRRRIQAIGDLDRAHISTIHSFASGLIREYAWDIDVDPDFQHIDDFDQALLLNEIFAKEFATVDLSSDDYVLKFMSAGGMLSRLAMVTACLVNDYDIVTGVQFTSKPVDIMAATTLLWEQFRYWADFAENNCVDKDDAGYTQIASIVVKGINPRQEHQNIRILELISSLNKSSGNQKNWRKEPLRKFKAGISDIKAEAISTLSKHYAFVVEKILLRLTDTIRVLQETKRRRGLLTFQDQLYYASKLFDDPDIQADISNRFRCLLIDEFQDTDPIQAKIALAMIEAEKSPRKVLICIVGDAKQSIYRFRRADEKLFHKVSERIGSVGRRVSISQNFRSVSGIIHFVNAFFTMHWNSATTENPFIELSPLPNDNPNDESIPVKVLELPPMDDSVKISADEIRRNEANAVARLIQKAVRDGWKITGKGVKPVAERDVSYGDIVILMPARTGIEFYTDALATAGIPFHVEGGKGLLTGQFPRDLINLIEAIDNPADKLSVVSALRTPFFGVSDPEIADWVKKSGNRFDIFHLPEGISGRLIQCATQLKEWNLSKNSFSPEQLLRSMANKCSIVEILLADPARDRDLSVWNFMLGMANEATVQGDNWRYFRRKLTRLSEEDKEIGDVTATSKKTCVRLMTIHGAKGLEFPMVILANFNKPHDKKPIVIIDREKNSVNAVIKTGAGIDLMTLNYEEVEKNEKEEMQNERLRLLYVAMTRAKDYLIISRIYNNSKSNPYAEWIGRFIDAERNSDQRLFEIMNSEHFESGSTEQSPSAPEPQPDISKYQEIVKMRSDGVRVQLEQKLGIVRPGVYDYEQSPFSNDSFPDRAPEFGIAIGRAVHAYCAKSGKTDEIDRQLLERVCIDEGIAVTMVEPKIAKILKHPVWKRAIAAQSLRRELPVSAMIGNNLMRGVIDLIWEEQGNYCIADIKTGLVRSEHQTQQLELYAKAIEKCTGKTVSEKILIYTED